MVVAGSNHAAGQHTSARRILRHEQLITWSYILWRADCTLWKVLVLDPFFEWFLACSSSTCSLGKERWCWIRTNWRAVLNILLCPLSNVSASHSQSFPVTAMWFISKLRPFDSRKPLERWSPQRGYLLSHFPSSQKVATSAAWSHSNVVIWSNHLAISTVSSTTGGGWGHLHP